MKRHLIELWETGLDVVADAISNAMERPGRSVLLALAFAVGCAGFVTSVGFSETSRAQISADLLPSQLDRVNATLQSDGATDLDELGEGLVRLRAVGSVVSAGASLDVTGLPLSTLPPRSGFPAPGTAAVLGAEEGWLSAAGVHSVPQSAVAQLDGPAANSVALIGTTAAQRLGISCLGPGCALWVGERRFEIVGYLSSDTSRDSDSSQVRSTTAGAPADSPREDQAANSVVISLSAAHQVSSGSAQATVLVRTRAGQARPLAERIAVLMTPEQPGAWVVDPVLDLANVRRGVQTSLDRTTAAIAIIVLTFSGLAVAITLGFSALSRAAEIGLRRALGQSRRQIWALFVLEGAAIGVFGGAIGTSLGVIGQVVVCWRLGWTPVLDPRTAIAGLGLGCLIGVLASTYPALRAARTDPATAIR